MWLTRPLTGLPAHAAILAALLASSSAQAGNGALQPQVLNETIQIRFDPERQETKVAGHVAPGLCFSIRLPQEWRVRTSGPKTKLETASSYAELELGFRSAHELRHMPQPDLASRDAAVLQRDYEDLLGRPAQSVSLAASVAGVTRWSATWIDIHLPAASHAMTVETFIVPLSSEWILELSLSNVDKRESYDALMQTLLAELNVQGGAACGG
jgi:hypothetical protein